MFRSSGDRGTNIPTVGADVATPVLSLIWTHTQRRRSCAPVVYVTLASVLRPDPSRPGQPPLPILYDLTP